MESFNGYLVRKGKDEDGNTELTFRLNGISDELIAGKLQKEILYRLQLSEVKSKRTIEQNKFLWAVIHEIAIAQSGDKATADDDWDVYLQALEKADAKVDYIACLPEAYEEVRRQFRATKIMNEFEHKGKTFYQVKVIYGSHHLKTDEMSKLIDTLLDIAAQEGIVITDNRYE